MVEGSLLAELPVSASTKETFSGSFGCVVAYAPTPLKMTWA
jgi:hypothetical protein